MNDTPLTEREAARLWALAYNTHDAAVLAPVLADDVRVTSQWVVNDMVGREAYLDYLAGKFTTFETAGSMVRVGIGEAPGSRAGATGRPCALIEQDGNLLATVLFDVIGGRLSHVSLSSNPSPVDCLLLGDYPGFENNQDHIN